MKERVLLSQPMAGPRKMHLAGLLRRYIADGRGFVILSKKHEWLLAHDVKIYAEIVEPRRRTGGSR